MAKTRQLGMAAGTVCAALGIGFVMQNGDALASRFGADTPAAAEPAPFTAEQAVVIPAALEASDDAPETFALADPEVSEPSMVSPEAAMGSAVTLPNAIQPKPEQETPEQFAALETESEPEVQTDAPVVAEVDCVPTMTSSPMAGSMISLSIAAPCYEDAAFTLHHQGMMFTAKTDANGDAALVVPALAEVAVMIAAFENGDGAVATSVVPDFASYDRAVLQWEGEAAVTLSAYENGADFGDQGHISAANPGTMDRLGAAEGGYLVRLGEPVDGKTLMAEVYVFPTGMVAGATDVMLLAEAEITAGNCGKDLSAQSIQVSPNGTTNALDLTMVMPECDAVGDFLILQNMFEDLTIASR